MDAPVRVAPVTVLVTRRVLPGRSAEFEALMDGMTEAARNFPGHLSCYQIKPGGGDRTYHALFAFDDKARLQAWLDSPERASWLERIAAVTFGDNSTRILCGLEGWFALPSQEVKAPPPRYKMALLAWSGIFPLVLVLTTVVGPVLRPISTVFSVLVITFLVVVLMTWAVMPLLTRLLAWWLYPASRVQPW
jgi:antibiotic biosynthesis monooxygenase (ABM) superfamily enzyme